MRTFTHLLRSAKFVHAVHIAVIIGAVIIIPATTAQTVHVIHTHAHPLKKPVVKTVVSAPAKKPTPVASKPSTPAATPATPPAPAPTQVVPPTPAPKPTAQPAPAPAVVASTGAAPGTSVHTLTPAPTPTSSSSTATASSTTSTSSTTSSTGNTTGSTSSTPTTSSSSTILANPDYTSYNWAGYMANSTTYTAIRGSWIVPNPTGNSTATTADATWIGIGGISTSDLIQVGSEDTVSAAGAVSSAVFYELLPASPVYPTTIAISPGDVLTASITEQTTGTWVITITDSTNSQSFTTTVSYPSKNNSAEWIEEDPSYANGSLVPFDNFGTVNFSGASATTPSGSQTISAVHGSSIAMVTQSGTTLAGPTALGSDGASFSVIRQP